jgi:hypothetical protein
MSNVFSRACALFVVFGGLAASAFPQGITDVTLANAGWTCI